MFIGNWSPSIVQWEWGGWASGNRRSQFYIRWDFALQWAVRYQDSTGSVINAILGGLCQLLYSEWVVGDMPYASSTRVAVALIALVLGLFGMSLIGKWTWYTLKMRHHALISHGCICMTETPCDVRCCKGNRMECNHFVVRIAFCSGTTHNNHPQSTNWYYKKSWNPACSSSSSFHTFALISACKAGSLIAVIARAEFGWIAKASYERWDIMPWVMITTSCALVYKDSSVHHQPHTQHRSGGLPRDTYCTKPVYFCDHGIEAMQQLVPHIVRGKSWLEDVNNSQFFLHS